jgi:hypothetical protein
MLWGTLMPKFYRMVWEVLLGALFLGGVGLIGLWWARIFFDLALSIWN